MSLRVWLPLNGTLDNQGLDQVVAINTNVVYVNGKIGKCLFSNSSSSIVSFNIPNLVSLLANGKKYSLACWIKLTNNTSSGWVIKFGSNSCGLWWARSSPRLVWNENDNGKRSATSIASDYNNWHHVVTTVDKSVSNTIKLVHYVDGILSDVAGQIFDNSTFLQPTGETLTLYPYNALLNDIRLYDHILSPFEVKQISQGLILHYPLNNNGWGQENLLAGTNQIFISNNEFNRTLDLAPIFDSYGLVPYTISFDLKSTDVSNRNIIMVYCQNGSGTRHSILQNYINNITTEFKRYSVTVTPILEKQNLTQSYLAFYGNYNTGNKPVVKNIKVELGEKATPWCPNEADELYNKLGLNENIQYDTSGYNNNGVKTGTFTYNSDTPKYNVSTVFSKSQYIIESNEINTTDSTIVLWIKSALSENAHVLDARNSSGVGKQPIYQYTNGSIQTGGNNAYVTTNTGLLVANTWVHIALVQSGNSLLIYKNGVLFQTLSCNNSSIIKPTVGARFNFSNKYNGQLSDLRIYVTTLSAEDIKSLYNNSVYIDNQGNIYGVLYEEV